jgi:hypothetical protein
LGMRNKTCERDKSEPSKDFSTDPCGRVALDTYLHRVQLSVRRLAHGELNQRDAQAPDVGLEVVAGLLNDFGRHPVGSADEGVLRGEGMTGVRLRRKRS